MTKADKIYRIARHTLAGKMPVMWPSNSFADKTHAGIIRPISYDRDNDRADNCTGWPFIFQKFLVPGVKILTVLGGANIGWDD